MPDDLDDRAAALIEPLATPVHAHRLSGGVAGKTVVILGAGTIGLLLLAVVRHHNPRGSSSPTRSRTSAPARKRLGADEVIDASADDLPGAVRAALGESADVVFDCVAVQATVTAAIAIADKGGTVVDRGSTRRRRGRATTGHPGSPDPDTGQRDVLAAGLR